MEEQKFVITADQENQRLDVFLTEQLEGSRSYIQQLIKDGHVKVHPKKAKPNLRLTEGMEITLTIPEPESTEV